jgi:hypothetical protein
MKGNAEPRAFADPEDAGEDRGRCATPSLWLSRGDHRDLGRQLAFVAILVYNWIVTTALGYCLWNKVLAMMSPVMAGQVLTLTRSWGSSCRR